MRLPFCQDSGDEPGEYCDLDLRGERAEIGLFTPDNRPHDPCTLHVPILYDRISGEWREDDGEEESLFLSRYAALDDADRDLPDGVTPRDREYDLGYLLGEERKETETAVSGGLGEWERIRVREKFRRAPLWYRHFFSR